MKVMKLNQSANIFIGNHFHVAVCILIPEILLYFYLNIISSGLEYNFFRTEDIFI